MTTKFYTEQTLGTIYADRLRDALDEGFVPCMSERTTLGRYGAQIVLAKDSERITFAIDTRSLDDEYDERDRLRHGDIVFVKYVRFHFDREHSVSWNYNRAEESAEVIAKLFMIRLGVDREPLFVEDEDYARSLVDKHYSRSPLVRRNTAAVGKYTRESNDFELTDDLLDTVRRIQGFKTVDSRYIRVYGGNGRYTVENIKSGNRVIKSVNRYRR